MSVEEFEISSGESDLAFHPFKIPRSNPDRVAGNARCLDRQHRDGWSGENFDGENWEQSIERLRATPAATGSLI